MAGKKKWPPSLLHFRPRNLSYSRVNGVNHYFGPWDVEADAASPEAKASYGRFIASLAAGQTPAPSRAAPPATVADVAAAWWEHEAPRHAEKERDNYRLSLEPLLRLYGPTEASQFDAAALEVVQLAMASGSWLTPEEKEAGRISWCAGVVNKRISRIKTVWRWAERRRLVPAGAWSNIRILPGLRRNDRRVRHSPKRRAATWDEVRDVARHAPPAVRAVLLVMWWSGMRPAEAYTMTAGEIDTTGDLWIYRPDKHKTAHLGHARAVPLNRKAQAVLRPWLAKTDAPTLPLFRPKRRTDGHQALVYNDDSFAQAVKRSAARAGRKGVTAYCIRHSVKNRATRLCGLDAARSLLGQASLSSTAGYGDAADLELAKEAARRLC